MEVNPLIVIDRKNFAQSSSGQVLIPDFEKKKDKVPCTNSISLVEKALISKLQVGDYSAFSSIFNTYYPDLVIFASRFTHDLSNSEEIVQDTFVKLWEERESVKIINSLKSYLLKTVQNKCIDWYRHKKIIQAHGDFVTKKPPQFALDTDSYLLYSELNEQIENALNILPEEIAEAFWMSRHKGLKYHEIADILGVSVRTIEVRIGKALNLLRSYLKDYFILILAFQIFFI
jgi:RNA polymerase sigma-70 factor (ECF subfamily)